MMNETGEYDGAHVSPPSHGWQVLLVEAGGQEALASDVPGLAADLQLGPMDWGYRTEPQPGVACLGLQGGRCPWPRGHVIGGSSVLNYMLYVRGNQVGSRSRNLPPGSPRSLDCVVQVVHHGAPPPG